VKKLESFLIACLFVLCSSVYGQGLNNLRIQGNPLAFCAGLSYTALFDTASIGGGTFQLQVSTPTGSFVTPVLTQNSSQVSINFQIPGSVLSGTQYAIRVIRLSPTLLISDTLKNRLVSNPQVNFSFSPNNACPATPVSFSNTSTGQGTLSYAWTFNNTYTFGAPAGSVLAEPTVEFNPFFGGGTISYQAKLVLTDAVGCKDSMSSNVGVRQRPLAALQDSNVFAFPAFSNCLGSPSSSNPNFRLTVNNACEVKATISSIQINWGEGLPINLAGNFVQASHVYTALGAYNLTLNVLNNNGCSTSNSYLVSNQLSPTISLGGPAAKQGCAPFRYPIIMSNYSGNSAGTYYEFDFNDGSPKLRIDTVTSDTVWHTFNSNSCSKPGGFFVVRATAYNQCDSTSATLGNFRVWTKPRAGFTINPAASICGGDTAYFVNTTNAAQFGVSCANTTLYTWQFSGGSVASSNLATPPPVIYTIGGVHPVRLIATNPCGSDTFTGSVCVQAAPQANFTYQFSPSNACKSNELQLRDISSTTTACGASTVLWTILDSSTNLPLSAGIGYEIEQGKLDSGYLALRFLAKGRYRIRLFIQNACGNSTRDTFLRISDIPVISFGLDSSVFCDSISIAFNGALPAYRVQYDSAFASGMTFNWQISPPGFSFLQGNANSRNPIIKFVNNDTIPRIYKILHTATNFCGVSVADSHIVVVNPKPRVFVSGNNSLICSGTASNLQLSSNIIGGLNFTWRAFSNNPNLSGFSNETVGVLGPIAQTLFNLGSTIDTVFYKIVPYQSSTMCRGDSSIAYSVLVQPALQNNIINGKQSICAGDTAAVFTGNVPFGGSGSLRYQWQRWNGTAWVNTAAKDTLATFAPGILVQTSIFRRLVSTALCASAPVSQSNADTVIVFPKPNVQAGNDIQSCINHAPIVLGGSPAGGVWSGLNLVGSNGFNPATAGIGSYTFVYAFTDVNTCFNADTLQITVHGTPVVEAGANFTICSNADTVTLAGNTPLGGVWSGLGAVNPNKFVPSQSGFGVHVIRYQYTDANACSNADSLVVTVKEKPLVQFGLNPNPPQCAPVLVQTNNTSLANNGDALSTMRFRWRVEGVQADTGLNISRTFTNSGIMDSVYTIQLWGENSWSCRDSVTRSVRVWPHARAQFTASRQVSCAPFSLDSMLIQTNHFAFANGLYTWYANGVYLGNSRGFPGYVLAAANDSVEITLRVGSLNNCLADSMRMVFKTISNPSPNFTAVDSVVCSGTRVQFVNLSNPNSGLLFNWQLGRRQDSSTLAEPNKVFYNYGWNDTLVSIKLIAEIGSSSCKDSIVKNVLVKPLPKLDFVLSDSVLCYPNRAVVTVAAAATPSLALSSFRWKVLPNGILSNDTASVSLELSFTDNTSGLSEVNLLQLKAATQFGCIDSVAKNVRLATRPKAQFSFGKDSACVPFLSSIQSNSLYTQQVKWRVWQSGLQIGNDTASNSTITIPIHRGMVDSTYWVELISMSDEGCRDTVQKSLKAFPLPEPNFVSSLDSGCAPLQVAFVSVGAKQNPSNKQWFFGDGLFSSTLQDSVQHNFAGAVLRDTSYHVKLVLTSANACKDSLILNNKIKVKTVPKAFFTTNIDSACSPLDVFVTDKSEGNPQNYKWIFGNGDSSLLSVPPQPIRYFSNDSSTTFTLQLITNNICGADSFSKELLVRAEFIESRFSASSKIGCETLSVAFGDASSGAVNIAWNFGDGFGSNQRNPVHTYTQPGTYTVYQYASNRCSFDTSAQEIIVLPRPNFNIELPVLPVCANMPIAFKSNVLTPGNLLWDFGDGNTSTAQNPTHTYSSGGNKILKVTLTSLINNCSSQIIDTQFVHNRPQVNILSDSLARCFGQAFNLRAEATENPFYRWNMGDGVLKTGSVQANYVYALPGKYVVKVVAESVVGCLDSTTLILDVWPAPKVAFDYTPRDTCNGPAWVQFTNKSVGADVFTWDFGNGNTANTQDAQWLFSGIGKYDIKLRGTNTFGCSDSALAQFEILEQSFASFEMDDSSGCLPYPVQFKNTSKGAKNYVWYFGDGDTSTEVNPKHVYQSPGIYFVSLVAKAGVVCRDSFTFYKPIKVDEKAAINFSHVLLREQVPHRIVTFTSNSVNDFKFEWRFGEGSSATGKEVTHVYRERDSGCFNVELKVITTNNCDTLYTDTICLPSYWEGLAVPNAFTPDFGTDEVRVFKPIGLGLIQYQIKIYNKWGSLVWEDTELRDGTPAKGWNGKDLNGIDCMPGAYIWVIDATFISGKTWEGAREKDKSPVRRGSLTLIR